MFQHKISTQEYRNQERKRAFTGLEKMVAYAENYKAQDEEVRKKVEAKNALVGYCFCVKNSIPQEQFAKTFRQKEGHNPTDPRHFDVD